MNIGKATGSMAVPLTVKTVAAMLLFLPGVAAAEAATAYQAATADIINNSLPLPDNSFEQSLKLVGARLKTQGNSTFFDVHTPTPPISPSPQAVSPPAAAVPTVTVILEPAAIPACAPPVFDRLLSEVLSAARQNNPQLQLLNTSVLKWNDWKFRLAERSKDMLNYACLFKGLSPSSEAGDVILDEKNKLKSLASAKYQWQKMDDQTQLKVSTALLDLAMHMGNPSALNLAKLERSVAELSQLAGTASADQVTGQFKNFIASDTAYGALASKPLWTIAENRTRIRDAVCRAASGDPILLDIAEEIHHYNRHTNGVLAAHRMSRLALSLASLMPDLVGPAANTVLFGYITVTGGTEQEKILKELYIDKRLSSRATLLSEQAHLAFYNYQLGALTGNRLLMSCSRQLLACMTDAETAGKLLQSSALSSSPDDPVNHSASIGGSN